MLARRREALKIQFRKLKKQLKARLAAKPNFGSARLVLFALGVFMLFARHLSRPILECGIVGTRLARETTKNPGSGAGERTAAL